MRDNSDYDKFTETTPISIAFDALISKIDPKGDKIAHQRSVDAAIRETVGPSAQEHITAVFYRNKQLVVEVDSAIWATELSFFSTKYKEAVNKIVGVEAVDGVRFQIKRAKRNYGPK